MCRVRIDGTGQTRVTALPKGVVDFAVRRHEDGSPFALLGLKEDQSEVVILGDFCAPIRVAKRVECPLPGWGVNDVGKRKTVTIGSFLPGSGLRMG